ncbi:MAG: hypothetical protein IT259_14260, partial [Saprospiraceae bacterium]|nr:hypothetical protein [Saprospiraceae bacterium]
MSHLLVGYMLLAFSWWAVHLWVQNDLLLQKQIELLECQFSRNDTRGVNLSALEETAEYKKIVH